MHRQISSNSNESSRINDDSPSTDVFEEDQFNPNYHLGTLYERTESSSSDHKIQLDHLEAKLNECFTQNTTTHCKLNKLDKVLGLLINKIGLNDVTDSSKEDTSNDSNISPENSSTFDIINAKILKCISSNKLIHMKVDTFQKNLDLILENLDSVLMMSENFSNNLVGHEKSDVYRFPISSINELNRLDEELVHNERLMTNLIKKFGKIAGDCGDNCGDKVGIKVIEKMISPKLLTKFTWTGQKNGSHNIKLPFMAYSSIFYLFLQVMSKADRNFDTTACENFLKNNVFKNSALRLSRKLNKQIRRVPVKNETWRITKLFRPKSPQSSSRSNSIYLNYPQRKSDTDGEIAEAKANLKNLIAIKKETEKNRRFSSTSSIPKKCNRKIEMDKLEKKMSLCVKSNESLHSKVDKVHDALHLILQKILCGPVRETPPPPPPSSLVSDTVEEDEIDSFYFPIKSNTKLRDFNKRLSLSENFEEKMIHKFLPNIDKAKRICKQKFGISVVESIISPQLLLRFSANGHSNSNKRKLDFMKYTYVVDLFQKIISKIDKQFTRKECENFLRFTVFKYVNLNVARSGETSTVSPSEHYSEEEEDDDEENIQQFLTTSRISALSLVPDESAEMECSPRKCDCYCSEKTITEVQ